MSLTGKVAIVTGAGRGIGRASAMQLALKNASVVLLSRTESQLRDVAETITASGHKAAWKTCDVTSEQSVVEAFDFAMQKYGSVDIVINNAGVLELEPIATTSLETWRKALDCNLTGAFLVAREGMRRMENSGGCIVNIGSYAGRRGYEAQGAYCASKHGLAGLSKVMAIEGQPLGIRVHLISPGGVATELSSRLRGSRGADEADWMTSEEVAEAIVFCATQTGVAVTDELLLRRFKSEPWR